MVMRVTKWQLFTNGFCPGLFKYMLSFYSLYDAFSYPRIILSGTFGDFGLLEFTVLIKSFAKYVSELRKVF